MAKRDRFSGHIWVKVAGYEVELYDASPTDVDIVGIYLRDNNGQLCMATDFISLGYNNIVEMVFRGQIITGGYASMKAAVNLIRFVVSEGKAGRRY